MESELIDISGCDKAEVLAALYNAARPQGLGALHYTPEDITVDEARKLLDEGIMHFDYLQGRVMKVSIVGDKLDPRLYDRDNGPGAAERALSDIARPPG